MSVADTILIMVRIVRRGVFLRFLILTQYYPPEVGAAQIRLAALASHLVALGHTVEVVTTLPNHPTGRVFAGYRGRIYIADEYNSVSVHRTWVYPAIGGGLRRFFNYLSFACSCLIGLLKARCPDYLFVESPPLSLAVAGVLYSCCRRVALIVNISDLWPDSIRELGVIKNWFVLSILENVERWVYRNSQFVTAVTSGIRTDLIRKKNVPYEKVLFLPNGVDSNLFRPMEPDLELARKLALTGKKVLLFTGTLGYAQGLDCILRAMATIETRFPEVSLVLVGNGSERHSLEQLARTLGLSNTRFMDPRPPEFMSPLYSIAMAGLVSLRRLRLFEGARPSKILPIMACGKPVVYCGEGEGAAVVERAQGGLVVPPEDQMAFIDAVGRLVMDDDLVVQLGKNGRRYVLANCQWSSLVEAWLNDLLQMPNSSCDRLS